MDVAADGVKLFSFVVLLIDELPCVIFHSHHSFIVDVWNGALAVGRVAKVHRGMVAIRTEHARTTAVAGSITRYRKLISGSPAKGLAHWAEG